MDIILICIYLFVLYFTQAAAQLNLEIQSVYSICSTAEECRVQLCRTPTDCPLNTSVKFEWDIKDGVSKAIIPLNGSVDGITLSVRLSSHQNAHGNNFKWSGDLSKQWRSMSESLKFRLKCSDEYYGKSCAYHCRISSPTMECDSETGQVRCREGFRGIQCEQAIDCTRRCQNGKCDNDGNCVCAPGYEGFDCAVRASTCNALKPCLNGGTCFNLKHGAYECRCLPGFDGTQCERRMATCVDDNPCQNGAECQQDFGRPLRCLCMPDYHGQYCQVWATNCSSLPCQNNAHCVNINGDFGCVCKSGFVGKICDQKITKCGLGTCANGGKCTENLGRPEGIECSCRPGFFGNHCQMMINDCRTSPCLNNGYCQANITSFHCQCPSGYGGNNCEITIKTVELEAARQESSQLAWIIPLIITVSCFALITIFAIWLVHSRYRRWTRSYFDSVIHSFWFFHPQPPKVKPPPLPLYSRPSSDSLLLKTINNKEEEESKIGRFRVLSVDALCQNIYVDDPTSVYNSIQTNPETLHSDKRSISYYSIREAESSDAEFAETTTRIDFTNLHSTCSPGINTDYNSKASYDEN